MKTITARSSGAWTMKRTVIACIPIAFASAGLTAQAGGWGASMYQYGYNDPYYALSECRLALEIADHVLLPGQSTQVAVLGQFPADAFALAEATFDVTASTPKWISTDGGQVVEGDVVDIGVTQRYEPARGILADPADPLLLWSGTFTPETSEPRLIPVQAIPASMAFYPSNLTSSSVECEPAHARDFILVNPLDIRGALVAPGEGTSVDPTGPDSFVTESPEQAILIGMLIPAVQKVRIHPETRPTDLTIETEISEGRNRVPTSGLSFVSNAERTGFDLQPDWALADGYEYHVLYAGRTIRLRIAVANNRGLQLERLPNVFSSCVELDRRTKSGRVVSRLEFDKTTRIVTPDGRVLRADAIEVHAIQNNLKQIGLGAHVFQAHGAAKVSWSYPGGF